MAPMGMVPVAWTYLVAGLTNVGVLAQKVEALIELQKVMVPLAAPPFTLGGTGNGFEVVFRLPGKFEIRHQRLSLSSSRIKAS